MPKSGVKLSRIFLWWSAFLGSLIALFQASGSLSRVGVIGLVVCGSLGATIAGVEHGWHRAPHHIGTPIRLFFLVILAWIPLSALGWYVWPRESVAGHLGTPNVDQRSGAQNSAPAAVTAHQPPPEGPKSQGRAQPKTGPRPQGETVPRRTQPSTASGETALGAQQAPEFGNLDERATALSEEILGYLCDRGWPDSRRCIAGPATVAMGKTSQEVQEWTREVSNYFRSEYLQQVVDIRNEFSQFHIEDKELDELLQGDFATTQLPDRQMKLPDNRPDYLPQTLPQEIQIIADDLRGMAGQIRIRETPKPLDFKISQPPSDRKDLPLKTVVTINTDAAILSGFVVVEFDSTPPLVVIDMAGWRPVNTDQIKGNRPLADYGRSHVGRNFVVEIGPSGMYPSRPIHLFLYSSVQVKVTNVWVFEE
jgi:hypothetical protein